MKVRELLEAIEDNSMMVKLSGVLSQVRGRIMDTGTNAKMPLESLLNTLKDQGINMSAKQFMELQKSGKLDNLVANVSGKDVTFIGQDDKEDNVVAPDKDTGTLEKMASRASKKSQL